MYPHSHVYINIWRHPKVFKYLSNAVYCELLYLYLYSQVYIRILIPQTFINIYHNLVLIIRLYTYEYAAF